MFIGHFAVGFAAKTVAPRLSLGALFLAVQFVDLLWPLFILMGIEHVLIVPGITKVTPLNFNDYPLSHSLFSVVIWGLLFGSVYFLMQRYPKGAIVLGLGVVSHWFLDLIVHRPDLPLYFGESPYVGFGLWNSPVGTLLVEGILFCAGVFMYMHTTYAKDRIGTWAFWSLVGFLVIVYIGNFVGPVPPSVQAIAWVGNAQWILIAWAYWVDRHRIVNNHTTADIGG